MITFIRLRASLAAEPTRLAHTLKAACVCLLLLAMPSLGAGNSPTADETALEEQVKAAFVYRILSYVEWPPESYPTVDAPLVVGALGNVALATELASLLPQRRVGTRAIVFRQLHTGDSLTGVHALFVGNDADATLTKLATRPNDPLLVMSDMPHALERGSVINFVVVDGRVRFEVSLRAAQERGLNLSSRLLSVAYRVLNNN